MKFRKVPLSAVARVESQKELTPRDKRRIAQEVVIERAINHVRIEDSQSACEMVLEEGDVASTLMRRFKDVTKRLVIADVVMRKHGDNLYIYLKEPTTK